jgi:quercetin dioxygenase-like cupin family protein
MLTSQETQTTLDTISHDLIAHGPADNMPYAPTGTAYSVNATSVALEGGTDPTFGSVKWRTLINGAPDTPKEFVLGIAEFGPHGTLLPHRHDPAEFYLGIEGNGTVTIDGVAHEITAGVAIYVPGGAEHGVVAGENGLRFTYGFSEASFQGIEYRFTAAVA